jgi:hypothetical protein
MTSTVAVGQGRRGIGERMEVWMNDPRPRTAVGKVLWHFTMSLDGFVAGPNHDMSWLTGFWFPPAW